MKNCKYTINKSTIEFSSKARFCAECNNEIYDRELDQLTSEKAIQLYNQQHGIPGIDIVNFRKEHNLTQESLCKFLQISKKTLISYEREQAIPNTHYMTLLKAVIGDPSILSSLSDAGGISLTDKEKEFLSSVSDCTHEQPATINEFHGYTSFSVEKLINIILKFTEKGLGLTKLNKGLFYSDFSN
jgi:DNA-binding transcriptional regulator YiaG